MSNLNTPVDQRVIGNLAAKTLDLDKKIETLEAELARLRSENEAYRRWRDDVLLYLEEDENTEAIMLRMFAPPQPQP